MDTIVISLQRDKCIGCNFCAEVAPQYFAISKKDGKSNLVKSVNRKGFYITKLNKHYSLDSIQQASKGCPVKIIKINNKIALN